PGMNNRDVQLDKKLYDKKSVAGNALLTFVITEGIEAEALKILMNSIYDQCMPGFKILMHSGYERSCDKMGLNKENLEFRDKIDFHQIRTKYIMMADSDIIFSKNSIRMMINALLRDPSIDFVTAPLKRYEDGQLYATMQETAFTIRQCMKGGKSKYNKLDHLLGNKIFRRNVFLKILEGNQLQDGESAFDYGKLKYRKIANAYMILTGNSKEMTNEDQTLFFRSCIKLKMIQKKCEDSLLEFIKRHFTKDDIRRLLKREIV
ncbi:MAG: glycosyltransferase, partial [Bacillota bacterium]|nr:glycosyltransferase [Bacillota bacterium]